jgi:hypothetical protein
MESTYHEVLFMYLYFAYVNNDLKGKEEVVINLRRYPGIWLKKENPRKSLHRILRRCNSSEAGPPEHN